MFDRAFNWSFGICDFCYNKHFYAKAIQKAPDVFDENGAWLGGSRTEELRKKWELALKTTEEEMQQLCVHLSTVDGDEGKLCESCLRKILEGKKNGS